MSNNGIKSALALTFSAWALCGAIGIATAQPVYRVVDANGKVTFSDQPPSNQPAKPVITGAASDTPAPILPYALRQAASKYPVTLYAGPDCVPCSSGRALLQQRGVPFTERSITSAYDAAALQRVFGDNSIPVLTVGTVTLKGLSETEWNQTLDVAGYPKTSQLPAAYRNPPVAPLVPSAPKPTAAPSNVTNSTAPDTPLPPRAPNPANPAGIQF